MDKKYEGCRRCGWLYDRLSFETSETSQFEGSNVVPSMF